MDKWEYKIEQYNFLENGYWINFLNQMGQEGWELIQKDKSNKELNLTTCIFKRKIQQENI